MEHEFTLNRRRVRLSRQQVLAALRGVAPDRVYRHQVEVGGVTYPVKQALAVALGVDRCDVAPNAARRVLRLLGFTVTTTTAPIPGAAKRREPRALPADVPRYAAYEIGPGEMESLELGPLPLFWCQWQWWEDIRDGVFAGGSFEPPPARPGVYEVKREGERQRLTIGKASDLCRRVTYDLVKGSGAHPAGRKIREREDLSRLVVRWAETNRPAAVEEELHNRHVRQFGSLPTYTQRT